MPMPVAHRQWRAAAFEPHGSTAMPDEAMPMARGRLVSVCVWEVACVGCGGLRAGAPLLIGDVATRCLVCERQRRAGLRV